MPEYDIVEMFADHAYAGSPMGVVPAAQELSTEDMQLVAREIALAETAFVLPPDDSAADYRVRVFTPVAESPYGGHSALGTAVSLVRRGIVPVGKVTQQCGPKLLTLTVDAESGTIGAAGPLEPVVAEAGPLLAAAGLGPADLAHADAAAAAPRAVGFGPAFHFLPVRRDALDRAALHAEAAREAGLADVFVFAWDAEQRTAHARLFAPGYGMPEDAACSSAALGLGLWLHGSGWLPRADGTHEFLIRQGAGMGRPATMHCTVTVSGGRPTGATVAGRVERVAHGRLALPPRAARPQPGGVEAAALADGPAATARPSAR